MKFRGKKKQFLSFNVSDFGGNREITTLLKYQFGKGQWIFYSYQNLILVEIEFKIVVISYFLNDIKM